MVTYFLLECDNLISPVRKVMSFILLILIFSTILTQCSIQNVEEATAGNITGSVFEKESDEPISDCEILIALIQINGRDTFYFHMKSDTLPPIPRPDTVLTDINGYYEYSWGWIGGGGGIMIVDLSARKVNYEALDTSVTVSINALKVNNDAEVNLFLDRKSKLAY
jgi:hypothetical protein